MDTETTVIYGEIVEVEVTHSDAGPITVVRCPKCKDTVRVADHAWWPQTCACGLRWSISAVGEAS